MTTPSEPSPDTAPDRRQFLQQAAGAVAAVAIQPTLVELAGRQPRAPLTVGLIGVGRQGRAILAELQKMEQVRVAAICDVAAARLRAGTRRAKGAEAHAEHRQLLDQPGIDAVIVATPTHAHRTVVTDALAAGKHVYCEAPLAHTVEDTAAIAKAARGADKVFQAGFLARSNPIYQLARSFLRSGTLRDVISLRAQDHEKTSWRIPSSDAAREHELNWRLDPSRSIGLPGELGAHQFDAISWFLDAYPSDVRANGAVRLHKDGREVPDTAVCDLRFADGAQLSWQASLCNSFEGRYEVFHGSMATIKLAWTSGWMFKEADAPTQGWEVYANREAFHNDEGITLIADATKLAKQGKLKEGIGLPQPPLWYGLADFIKSVTEAKPVACSAAEGYRSTVIGISANQALTSGVDVHITPELLQVG
ncbi:MAG: Gfo/Idh/MocA family oxidoreductase [Planctomycetota bacterium]